MFTSSLLADASPAVQLDLAKVFEGAPTIYILLLAMSLFSLVIWIYTLFTMRPDELMPADFMKKVRAQIIDGRYEAATATCQKHTHFAASVIAAGIAARKRGPQVVSEVMLTHGRQSSASLWQRLSLLNDIVVIAPMLGLLGTVLGMFYAFYDMNRSSESLSAIFDGLGIAVGTTVAGLVVAILSMVFYSTLKHRLIRLLGRVEAEALSVGRLIDDTPDQKS